MTLPWQLRHNGAENPDRWQATSIRRRDGDFRRVRAVEGDLIAWRYGAWRMVCRRQVAEVDMTEQELAELTEMVNGHKPHAREMWYAKLVPEIIVLRHEHGPMLLERGRGHRRGGVVELHIRTRVGIRHDWQVLTEPWMTCSCHGQIWPCQEMDRAAVAAFEAEQMRRLMATTEPSVCAGCLEPVTGRQKTVTFPEPSTLVPGAPGPTFHVGRSACAAKAEEYERSGRLRDDPAVTRLVTCPGIRFIHESVELRGEDRLDCSSGPGCTGLHFGRDITCDWATVVNGSRTPAVFPTRDCGHQGCLGPAPAELADVSSKAADVLWRLRQGDRTGWSEGRFRRTTTP